MDMSSLECPKVVRIEENDDESKALFSSINGGLSKKKSDKTKKSVRWLDSTGEKLAQILEFRPCLESPKALFASINGGLSKTKSDKTEKTVRWLDSTGQKLAEIWEFRPSVYSEAVAKPDSEVPGLQSEYLSGLSKNSPSNGQRPGVIWEGARALSGQGNGRAGKKNLIRGEFNSWFRPCSGEDGSDYCSCAII